MKVGAGTNKVHTRKVNLLFRKTCRENLFVNMLVILGYNTGSVGIAYIGTFNKIEPNKKQLLAGQLLMEEGVKLGKLIPDYKIYAHRQLIASESPGAAFYELIKKWDHWTNDPPEVYV